MIEEKAKTFEEIFNEWYKKFLAEEAGMNNEIKNAKKYREEKLNQARKEPAKPPKFPKKEDK